MGVGNSIESVGDAGLGVRSSDGGGLWISCALGDKSGKYLGRKGRFGAEGIAPAALSDEGEASR